MSESGRGPPISYKYNTEWNDVSFCSCIINQNTNSGEGGGERERLKRGGKRPQDAYTHDREKPPVPSIIQSFQPFLSTIQVCVPAGGREGTGKKKEVRIERGRPIVTDDQGRGSRVGSFQTAVVLLWNDGTECSDGVGFGAYRGKVASSGLVRK